MITVVITEKEEKICNLINKALAAEGYLLVDEAETYGQLKIIKKTGKSSRSQFQDRVVGLKNNIIREKREDLYRRLLFEVERPLIESVLRETAGNQLKASRLLGINRNTLHAKIKKLGVKMNQFKAEFE
ncbi:MAG: hypothetical protein JW867_07445 [Candidatus Omnitrophica bacterium]|nr:hypothetical protein [Candidatus Omnitrophota bacterium]